jgi:Arc/MetJ-type ribon-helix-helix transcriptional regulator
MTDVQVKISTASLLIDKIDEIVEEGYFQNRTEALNEAIRLLIKKYQLAKIKIRIETIREDTEKYPELSGIVESMHKEEEK